MYNKTWSYSDSAWSDLLTDFNGKSISYDEIGNPTTIGSQSLSWNSRQLQQIVDGENTYSYAYNIDGQRVSKTVNGVTTEYFYNGSILAGQKTGNDTLVFMYDNNGDYFGFTYNGKAYYYVKNAQNDVVAILDSDKAVVAKYQYDAWGNCTVRTTGGLQSNFNNYLIARANPFRYRSYYFDSETNFYYLNSRYYSPEMCRFLNADAFAQTGQSLLDKNLWAYCLNNPVTFFDPNGYCIIAFPAEGDSGDYEIIKQIDEENNYDIVYENGTYTFVTGDVIDITKQLNDEMRNNANTMITCLEENNLVTASIYFAIKEYSGGDWDLKSQSRWNLQKDKIYKYGNQFLRYDDIGNIHYGYVGRAVYPSGVLLIMGGMIQIISGTSRWEYRTSNFDDPRDQEMIAYGCMLWDNGGV